MSESRTSFDFVKSILEHALIGVLVTDFDGKILFVNREISQQFGYAPDELLSQLVEVLTPLNVQEHHVRLRENYLSHSPQPRSMGEGRELFGRHKQGHLIPVEIGLNLVNCGDHKYVICTIINITERQNLQDKQMKQLIHSLEKSNQELSTYASKVAHDLRAPLTVLMASARLLAKTMKLEGQNELLFDKIISSIQKMQTMITNLLDCGCLHPKSVHLDPVDLEEILEEVKGDLMLSIEKEQAIIENQSLPKIVGDKIQLRSVFLNLISNAIKYHKPSVPPHIIIECREPDNNNIEISFSDNGIGFQSGEASSIFECGKRANDVDTNTEGHGLGLSIVRKIVECHNGEVTAHVNKNGGATFVVILPKGS